MKHTESDIISQVASLNELAQAWGSICPSLARSSIDTSNGLWRAPKTDVLPRTNRSKSLDCRKEK